MKNTISFVFLLISNICLAQINPLWQFNDINGFNYYPTTNIINNGNYTFVCSQSPDAQKIAYLYKLDNSGNLVAQDSIHNFYYSFLDNKRMIIDNSGAIYLCGNIYDQTTNSKIRLIKYDQQLNRVWDISFIDPNTQTCSSTGLLFSANEDKLYLIGEKYDSTSRTIIVKFDTDGNFLWESQDTLSSTFSLTSYAIDHVGNVVFGGYAFINGIGTAEDFLVSKTDTAGNLLWMNRENGSSNSDDWVFDVCIDDNNNIYASGVFEDTARYKVFKYDPAGNTIWTRNVPDAGLNKIATDHSGSLYIVGYDSQPSHEFLLRKYDSAGNYITQTFSDIANYNCYNQDYFVSIQTDANNNVYLLHSADSSGTLKWLIAKLDSSLNLLWSETFPYSSSNPATPGSLCIVSGGIIVAGKADVFLRVVRFEEIISSSENILSDKKDLLAWPNPAKNVLHFQLQDKLTPNSNFEVHDINNKLISSGVINELKENCYSIPLESFNSGIYFLIVNSNNTYVKIRFVVP